MLKMCQALVFYLKYLVTGDILASIVTGFYTRISLNCSLKLCMFIITLR